MSTHRQHADTVGLARNRFAESLLGIALAVAIGLGLAAAMVYGWSR